jgi:hypothetical protein
MMKAQSRNGPGLMHQLLAGVFPGTFGTTNLARFLASMVHFCFTPPICTLEGKFISLQEVEL